MVQRDHSILSSVNESFYTTHDIQYILAWQFMDHYPQQPNLEYAL